MKDGWILEQHGRRIVIPDAQYRLGDSDSDTRSDDDGDGRAGGSSGSSSNTAAAVQGGWAGSSAGGGASQFGGTAAAAAAPVQPPTLAGPNPNKPIFLWLAGASGALPSNNNPMTLLEGIGEGVGPLPGLSGMASLSPSLPPLC